MAILVIDRVKKLAGNKQTALNFTQSAGSRVPTNVATFPSTPVLLIADRNGRGQLEKSNPVGATHVFPGDQKC